MAVIELNLGIQLSLKQQFQYMAVSYDFANHSQCPNKITNIDTVPVSVPVLRGIPLTESCIIIAIIIII